MHHDRHGPGGLSEGFSLIELMITVSIAAILLAVALPSLRGLVEGGRLSSVTNDLVYALQLSRSEAIKRAVPVRLCPSDAPLAQAPTCGDNGLASGWIVFADQNANGVLDTDERVILQREPDVGGMTFTASNSLQAGVRFDATGNSVAGGGVPNTGNVVLALPDGESRTVTVRASGRIASAAGVS